MSRRDEVWEQKRQLFLNRQPSGGSDARGPSYSGRPAPMSTSIFGGPEEPASHVPMPTSPLSQLVQTGYEPRQPEQPITVGGGCPPLPGSRGSAGVAGLGRQDSFDANVAQQWSSNVQSTLAQHQQQNDPNFCGHYKKKTGYRVNQAPGGASSISLSWGGGDSGDTASVGPGRGHQRAPSPSHSAAGRIGQRDASPFTGGAWGAQREASPFAGNQRAPSPSHAAGRIGGQRESSPFAAGAQRAQREASPFAAGGRVGAAAPYAQSSSPRGGGLGPIASADPEPRYGGGSGLGGRPPVPRADSRELGGGGGIFGGNSAGGGGALPSGNAFGARMDNRSSNAYACGGNQNCGNYLTDRRTTRVAAPPGGRSQISFG
jgi:hypothetical protein